jgi:hypothetical protein
MREYAITAVGRPAGSELARLLAEFFVGDEAIALDRVPATERTKCLFSPGAGYRFWRGPIRTDVVVSLGCSQIRTDDGFYDLGRIHTEVVRLTLECFPGDAALEVLE